MHIMLKISLLAPSFRGWDIDNGGFHLGKENQKNLWINWEINEFSPRFFSQSKDSIPQNSISQKAQFQTFLKKKWKFITLKMQHTNYTQGSKRFKQGRGRSVAHSLVCKLLKIIDIYGMKKSCKKCWKTLFNPWRANLHPSYFRFFYLACPKYNILKI